MARAVKVVGVGDFTPAQVVSNETMARAIPGWSADLIREKTGIRERRFLCEVDSEMGRSIRPQTGPRSNCDMSELALRDALKMGQIAPNARPPWLSTHPSEADRMRRMREALKDVARLYAKAKANRPPMTTGTTGAN